MSSVSLLKPLRATATAPRKAAEVPKEVRSWPVLVNDQDRSAATNDALSPALFWTAIMALALVLLINAAVGMALLGADWLTAYWDALDYWCTGGYCR